jgi:hypothetical protein
VRRIDQAALRYSNWGITREQEPPEENNAVLEMMKVVQAVDAWAAKNTPSAPSKSTSRKFMSARKFMPWQRPRSAVGKSSRALSF